MEKPPNVVRAQTPLNIILFWAQNMMSHAEAMPSWMWFLLLTVRHSLSIPIARESTYHSFSDNVSLTRSALRTNQKFRKCRSCSFATERQRHQHSVELEREPILRK